MPKVQLPKIKCPKIKCPSFKGFKNFQKPKFGKKFIIGTCVAVAVVIIGSVLISQGVNRPSLHAIAMNNIAEARHFMKYAHHGDICVQFSVGRREEPFNRDGVARTNVDFAIINVEDKGNGTLRNLEQIEGTITIAGTSHQFVLLQNPYNPSNFANDIIRSLTRAVTPNCEISVTLMIGSNNHPTVQLKNAFQDGAVTWEQALKIALEKIGDRVRGKQFEVFITIMHNVADSGNSMWYVQLVCECGDTYFAVVAPDGSVIG